MLRRLGRSATLCGPGDAAATGINQDSRLVRAADVYALPGRHRRGIEFVADAASRGAVAMLSDRKSDVLPTIVVDDPRRILGPLASWVYGDPSEALDVYGVN